MTNNQAPTLGFWFRRLEVGHKKIICLFLILLDIWMLIQFGNHCSLASCSRCGQGCQDAWHGVSSWSGSCFFTIYPAFIKVLLASDTVFSAGGKIARIGQGPCLEGTWSAVGPWSDCVRWQAVPPRTLQSASHITIFMDSSPYYGSFLASDS